MKMMKTPGQDCGSRTYRRNYLTAEDGVATESEKVGSLVLKCK